MESLTSSARSKLFSKHNSHGDFSSSRTLLRFLRFPKSTEKNVDFSHSISLRFVKSNESISSYSSFSSKAQANAEALIEASYESKNVHVKFQLQKECLFGEQFFLVGDDPIIGLWDPESAIPLDWSDEHIWTVELDLPIGKSIMFKFFLKGTAEEVFWQPGPDRIVETWETRNTIVVLEDWDNAEIQKITEEPSKESAANLDIDLNVAENISYLEAEPKACDNEGVAVADNITYPRNEPVVNENTESIIIENITHPKEESSAKTNNDAVFAKNKTMKEKKPSAKPKVLSLVAENIVATDKKLGGTQVVDLIGYVGEPVLVPGLTPLPNMSTEEGFSIKLEINSASDASFETVEAEDPGKPEPDENQENEKQEVNGIPNQEETSFTMISNKPKEEQNENAVKGKKLEVEHEPPDCQATLNDGMQNDFQWGQKTLRKLFTTLGFPFDQT